MSTSTPDAPWAKFDDKLRKSYRARDAADQWRYIENLGEDGLREKLTLIEVAQVELKNLADLIAESNRQIDAAVAEHQATCLPLQRELASPAITTARRVAIRSSIIQANEELEKTTAALRESIKAAEAEMAVQRSIVGGRVALENAWCNAAPAAERERVWVLNRVLTLMDQRIADHAIRESDDADRHLASLRATEDERRADLRRRGLKDIADPAADPESLLAQKARRAGAVADKIKGWIAECQHELDQIREKRLAELYD